MKTWETPKGDTVKESKISQNREIDTKKQAHIVNQFKNIPV